MSYIKWNARMPFARVKTAMTEHSDKSPEKLRVLLARYELDIEAELMAIEDLYIKNEESKAVT